MFSRAENPSQETIPSGEFRGFGHEFEKAYTRQQIDDSIGHHRIISYRLGGMSLVVRHETDGYDVKPGPSGSDEDPTGGLSGAVASLSLTSDPTLAHPYSTGSRLVVRREGQYVPLDRTLELKTRAAPKTLNIEDVAPQIWISQTPKLVRAYHRGGIFQEPKVENVTTAVQEWQTDNQVQLRTLVALIRRLLDIVKNCGNRATVRYVDDGDKLVISPSNGKRMLPESLYLHWEAKSALPRTPQVSNQVLVTDSKLYIY